MVDPGTQAEDFASMLADGSTAGRVGLLGVVVLASMGGVWAEELMMLFGVLSILVVVW